MFDPELESFKTSIDLRAYAAGLGYRLDRKESSRSTTVMRYGDGDKIIVTRKPDGHYTYWSVRDDKDHGTIIDFIAHRKNLNLGEIRKLLRAWSGSSPVPSSVFRPLQASSRDRVRVEAEYAKMQDAPTHPYLENERALSASLLGLERFAGRIRIDARGNAIFPHLDADGLCGFEKKNSGFTGYSSGGSKGLWMSHERPDDNRIVFSESAIDALSHAVLFPDNYARYASIGGKPNAPLLPGCHRGPKSSRPWMPMMMAGS
jgi:hypothetical protein